VRVVKLLIGFDGTRYEGWQSQLKGNTVQEALEKALERVVGQKTNLISSSRTDSGVHALGMAAHFKTASVLPDPKLKAALNYYLPKDILVHSAKTVGPEFHARYKAKSKLYRYDIWCGRTRPLFEAPYVYWYPNKLDAALMKKAARHFVGRHDFTAFTDRGVDDKKTTVRTIKRVTVQKKGVRIRIEVTGDGFLRHMVRILVGTLMEAGKKKLHPSDIPAIILSKDRKKAGPTAKAQGLTLVKVSY
jgi:tRNA pseudouridine38-40 synthase